MVRACSGLRVAEQLTEVTSCDVIHARHDVRIDGDAEDFVQQAVVGARDDRGTGLVANAVLGSQCWHVIVLAEVGQRVVVALAAHVQILQRLVHEELIQQRRVGAVNQLVVRQIQEVEVWRSLSPACCDQSEPVVTEVDALQVSESSTEKLERLEGCAVIVLAYTLEVAQVEFGDISRHCAHRVYHVSVAHSADVGQIEMCESMQRLDGVV